MASQNNSSCNTMESGCKTAWETYAAPSATVHEACLYKYKDGKPLIALYTTRPGYQTSTAVREPYRQRFSFAWALCEDSNKNSRFVW